MLRYLFGIFMVQLATVALVLLAPPNLQGISLLRLIVPLLVIGFVAAFWFSSLAHLLRKDELHKADKEFAKEREKIKVNAERAKTRVVKQAQKEVAKEARNTHAKANFKVGATFAAAIGLGALMLLTQFLTIGLLMMTTSGGALAGYLYRGRKQSRAALPSDNDSNTKLIEVKSFTKLLPPLLKRDKQ